MVNPGWVNKKLNAWVLMRYYPAGNEEAISSLVRMVCQMANNEAEVNWLVQRAQDVYSEWPGAAEIRRLFCSRFKPADDIDPNLPGGPMKPLGEADRQKVLAQSPEPTEERLLLGCSEPASQDPVLAKMVEIIGNIQAIKNAHTLGGPTTEEEIRTAPQWLRDLEGYE